MCATEFGNMLICLMHGTCLWWRLFSRVTCTSVTITVPFLCLLSVTAFLRAFYCADFRRLKDAGFESRIWESQTGFRSKKGSTDAVFVVRRLIELAWETQDGKPICLALDCAKAGAETSKLLQLNDPQNPTISNQSSSAGQISLWGFCIGDLGL